jgi:hypothetical protein
VFSEKILKKRISSLIHLVAIAGRQVGKLTWCVLGDEDTRFYHSRASARLRTNKIKIVESEGIRFFTHNEKERILTNYYRDILGKSALSTSLIELNEVYPNQIDLSALSRPFGEEEILKVLKDIPRDKSPGPDSFDSSFYRDYWNTIKPDIMDLFHQF